jgi:hypothetical protein
MVAAKNSHAAKSPAKAVSRPALSWIGGFASKAVRAAKGIVEALLFLPEDPIVYADKYSNANEDIDELKRQLMVLQQQVQILASQQGQHAGTASSSSSVTAITESRRLDATLARSSVKV